MPNAAVAGVPESLLTPEDVAAVLRMSREQVMSLIRSRELVAIQARPRCAIRIARADLEEMQLRWRNQRQR